MPNKKKEKYNFEGTVNIYIEPTGSDLYSSVSFPIQQVTNCPDPNSDSEKSVKKRSGSPK